MNLYKSNFPARYGGGLSSVIDVFTKDGNMKEWKGEANAGLLAIAMLATTDAELQKKLVAWRATRRDEVLAQVIGDEVGA